MEVVRRIGRSRLTSGLIVAIAIASLALGITVRAADLHLQTVLSNSMQPTLSAGDLAVTQAVPTAGVRVGDVITFYPPGSTRAVIHRVTSLRDGVVTTRGDANPIDDPWRVRLEGATAYRLVAVVPLVGWLTELQRPALLAAGLLLGLALLLELSKEVRARTTRSQPEPQS
ncbi:MAG TPA: signal peptidase I, partial [Candidatus Binatus sp.]|nr:signal peptidase I [Candidatus Binatus sp.]